MRNTTIQGVLVGVLGTVLVGCGGSSSSSSDDGGAGPSSATLSGTAAVGAPIVGAPVDARCEDGSGFLSSVTTDSVGRFQGEVNPEALPCALRVNGGTPETTLHSWAEARGTVNITPLTDLAIAISATISPANWYAQDDRGQRVQNLVAARDDLLATLRSQGYNVPGDEFDPFRTAFNIGDAADQLLDEIKASVAASASIEDYPALVALLSGGNLSVLPQAPEVPGGGVGDDGNDGGSGGPSGDGGQGGGGGSASAVACMSDLDQEGTEINLQFRTYQPMSGEVIGDVTLQQTIGGMVEFKGNTVQVMNTRTEMNMTTGQTILYGRQYYVLDQGALVLRSYGSETLATEGGTPTVTQWFEPSNDRRFDLSPGQSYRQIYTTYQSFDGGNPTYQQGMDYTETYEGRETVTVPAGTFETCKFSTQETGSQFSSASLSWISVEHGIGIQTGSRNSSGQEQITTEMLSLSINGAQQAP